ncbi:MAG: class I SAM-dependent methyltransferase [Labilithrix sp.]|nr:class I SAM-dependent methyltransferase [Labilithrix sp.]
MSFAYDEVPYDTEANPEAHPRSMATLGRLFGIETAPPSTARVLEIGCGDGEHMIGAASYLPGAAFVGFDLSREAVARGVAIAEASGAQNVAIHARDVRDVRATSAFGVFDYVVAHGVYSWVPEPIRADVLAVIRASLAPSGVAFLSVNALPGWELRRALRVLMREAAAAHADPAAKVTAALALVDDLAALTGEGFTAVLAEAAREYRAHVTRATPPDAPFSRYVFHDLLAYCNDPFSAAELEARARGAGLAIVCETPLFASRARAPALPGGIAAEMERTGSPFLQVLLCRDDVARRAEPDVAAIEAMHLWADLAPADAGVHRTTTGALLRAAEGSALARAALAAPGFVAVRDLADGEERTKLAHDLFVASCEGILSIATEPAPIAGAGEKPRVAPHVRARAASAVARGAESAVLTSALHRSFRVPRGELAVIAALDGATSPSPRDAGVVDRFARHGFFLAGDGS